jgi:8-oxo-dGTP pyrophosphatase MutT (NUDIX family)
VASGTKMDVGFVRRALENRARQPVLLSGNERYAAVAAVLRERAGEAEVLLIRRAEQVSDPWSGHMAFPGGRRDPEDEDVLATAIRETEEEVGIRLSAENHLLGRLDDLPAIARGKPTGLVIAPFVFALPEDPELVLREKEVAEFLWASLGALASGTHDTIKSYRFEGRDIELPGYDVEGRIVWGLTHRMLSLLFDVLAAAKGAA